MSNSINKNFQTIRLITKIYALAIAVFFVFRFLLFLNEIERVDFAQDSISTILKAFFMGVRFDVVISGYILLIPALVLSIVEIIGRKSQFLERFFFWWVMLFFSICFLGCAADIPLFNHFFQRLNVGAFEWFDSPDFVLEMIVREPSYILASIPLLMFAGVFYYFLEKIFRNYALPSGGKLWFKIIGSLLFLGLMFLGVRGRIEQKSPIRIGTAYFSNNAFLNQLGLNPMFTFMRSWIESQDENNAKVNFMEGEIALSKVRKELGDFEFLNEGIARKITPDSAFENKKNVVLIVMESMSAAKMTRHGNQKNLTPFLDSLAKESYYFENIYTAGKHTFNGIFGTYFSFPSLYRQHCLKEINQFDGIATTLKKQGYSTTYFTNHDGQFDNVEGFLRANDFEKVVSEANYPSREVKTNLGVPDDFMFNFSMPIIDELAADERPFFATFMTTSDHTPYYLPEHYPQTGSPIKDEMVKYADWSLRGFMTAAAKKSWFKNTLFVFVADHGVALSAPYDISMDYHHSPLLFFAPDDLKPKNFEPIGGQIDVFPTIMGLLNLPYVNNTLGIDLLREQRPYIMVNDDDKIGVIDNEFFLILKKDGEMKLHKYRTSDRKNYFKEFPEKAAEMADYAKANMQVFQNLLLEPKLLRVKNN